MVGVRQTARFHALAWERFSCRVAAHNFTQGSYSRPVLKTHPSPVPHQRGEGWREGAGYCVSPWNLRAAAPSPGLRPTSPGGAR